MSRERWHINVRVYRREKITGTASGYRWIDTGRDQLVEIEVHVDMPYIVTAMGAKAVKAVKAMPRAATKPA